MSVVNTLMVCLCETTRNLIEKYCEHVVTNVKVGLDAGTIDSEHIVALKEGKQPIRNVKTIA